MMGDAARLGAEPRRCLSRFVEGRARLGTAPARPGAEDRHPQELRAADGDRRAGAADAADRHHDRARKSAGGLRAGVQPRRGVRRMALSSLSAVLLPAAGRTTTRERRSPRALPSASASPQRPRSGATANWGGGNVNINVNRYNSININRQLNANQTNFQHNAANRRGVPYRDAAASSSSARACPARTSAPTIAGTTGRATRSASRRSPRCSSAAWTRARDATACATTGHARRAQRAAEGTGRDRAARRGDRAGAGEPGGGDRAAPAEPGGW